MSATIVREKNQTTLPADVLEAAGIRPRDQVDWSFEDGKIVGRKLVTEKEEELTLVRKGGHLMLSKKLGRKEILARIRADREGKSVKPVKEDVPVVKLVRRPDGTYRFPDHAKPSRKAIVDYIRAERDRQ